MGQRLGERLVEAGLISGEAIDQALKHQLLTNHRLGDCLFELNLISEATLLRFLAGELKTRFVSADKLSKAKIPPDILDKVPVRLCEAQHVVPLAFDAERGLLSVVMAEPQNAEAIKEVRTVSGANEVFAYVALRGTLNAGIRRHYYGDASAFDTSENDSKPGLRADVAVLSRAYELGSSPGKPSAQSNTNLSPVPGGPGRLEWAAPTLTTQSFAHAMSRWARLFDARRTDGPAHSTRVARLCAATGRKLGMGPFDIQCLQIAAYVHDVGMSGEGHLTLLTLARRPGQLTHAESSLHVPLALFDPATVQRGIKLTLLQRFEAFDGSGLPTGLKGEEISMGARVLAAVEAWVDLTTHAQNVFGHTATANDAHTYLAEEAGTLFDPTVLDALKQVTAAESITRAIAGDGRLVLVCEPDEATRTDLLDALGPLKVDTYCVPKLENVFDAVLENQVDLICLGLRLGVSEIAAAVHWTRGRPERAALPVVVLGQPTETKASGRLTQVGVSAFLKVPVERAETETTITGLLADALEHGAPPRPVEGGLQETSLRNLASLVGQYKKTGRLSLFHGTHSGSLHFEQGRIVHAVSDELLGRPALEAMLSLNDAEFIYEPDALLAEAPTLNVDPTA